MKITHYREGRTIYPSHEHRPVPDYDKGGETYHSVNAAKTASRVLQKDKAVVLRVYNPS